jgi:GT2 family glycosyltransferase
VVVVSRNREALLRRCLESLRDSQGQEALQTIVVDNGSTDGSAQLEAEFPQLRLFRLPKNFGLTKALNIGWRAAEAEYVLFLHDDTEVAPDAIDRLVAVLELRPPYVHCWWMAKDSRRRNWVASRPTANGGPHNRRAPSR